MQICCGIAQSNFTHTRIYYKALASSQPEEAMHLLQAVSELARRELFEHSVMENVLVSSVDYVTLGWTRMLQAVLDLSPPEEMPTFVPLYSSISSLLIVGISLIKCWRISCSLSSQMRINIIPTI